MIIEKPYDVGDVNEKATIVEGVFAALTIFPAVLT